MADEKKIKIPDIGGAAGVDVIEILVKVGDEIGKDTPLITLESDKASMEIPSPESGTVQSIEVKVGDKVSEGDVILMLAPSQSNTQQESDFKSQENSESKSEKKTTNDKKNSDKKERNHGKRNKDP